MLVALICQMNKLILRQAVSVCNNPLRMTFKKEFYFGPFLASFINNLNCVYAKIQSLVIKVNLSEVLTKISFIK